jgi:hypothetical protein
VECLKWWSTYLANVETLGSNTSTAKKKKKRRRKIYCIRINKKKVGTALLKAHK